MTYTLAYLFFYIKRPNRGDMQLGDRCLSICIWLRWAKISMYNNLLLTIAWFKRFTYRYTFFLYKLKRMIALFSSFVHWNLQNIHHVSYSYSMLPLSLCSKILWFKFDISYLHLTIHTNIISVRYSQSFFLQDEKFNVNFKYHASQQKCKQTNFGLG